MDSFSSNVQDILYDQTGDFYKYSFVHTGNARVYIIDTVCQASSMVLQMAMSEISGWVAMKLWHTFMFPRAFDDLMTSPADLHLTLSMLIYAKIQN